MNNVKTLEKITYKQPTMLFDQFDPREDNILRIIDNDGEVINKELMPDLDDEILIKSYKSMLFARTVDQMAVSYQRQGRMYTYPPILGQEAIQIAAQKLPDIILMDVRLPDMDGFEVTRQIKLANPNLKIIAQTAYASHDDKLKAFDAGCIDYISKPLNRDLLLDIINKHLMKL